MPPYTRDWGNATGSETLIAAACRHLTELADVREAAPGDVLVFRMRDAGVAKHTGILVSDSSCRRTPASSEEDAVAASLDSGLRRNDSEAGLCMIHSQEGLGVVEIPLGRWWLRRAVGAYRYPSP
ncbi:MAG TPA: hypothetical protein VFD26_01705 [Methyloceanibacter sp.]|nr:hypothetical protein [Methyloceanibacter sp.]